MMMMGGVGMPVFIPQQQPPPLRLPLAEGQRHRTALATQPVAPPVAGLHHIFEDTSHHVVRQMPREVFRATVPKTDPPFPVHDVNPHRQVFHHMPESLRLSRRFEDMTWPRRLLVSSAVKAGNFRSQKSSPAAHA
jgi:hypothetical protein